MTIKIEVLDALAQLSQAQMKGGSVHAQALRVRDAAQAGQTRLRAGQTPRLTDQEHDIVVDARYLLVRIELALERTWLDDARVEEPTWRDLLESLESVGLRARSLPERRSDPRDTIRPKKGRR